MITEKNGGIDSAPDVTLASLSMEWMEVGIGALLTQIAEWSEIPSQSGAGSYYWPHPHPFARCNNIVSERRLPRIGCAGKP